MPGPLEEEVRRIYQSGVEKGRREHDAIRAAVEVDKEEPSPECGYLEDLARVSDLAEHDGAIEGLRDALLALARALDERGTP